MELSEKLKKCEKAYENLKNEKLERESKVPFISWLSNFNEKKLSLFINAFLNLFFLISIGLSLVFAVFNFSTDFYNKELNNKEIGKIINNEIQKDTVKFNKHQIDKIKNIILDNSVKFEKIKSNERDLNLFNFIEHIFIYLIPILIFLGLYFYFKTAFESKLTLTSNPDKHTEEIIKAKDSIQLTKSLFLTSIMSYVIIKIVEKTFLSNESINTEKLITSVILLLLLMFYLLMSHFNSKRKEN